MANINKDYLIIADLKNGKVQSPTMKSYNTDKRIFNIFTKLQITMSSNPDIKVFVTREEASDYIVKLTVIKPKTKQLRYAEGELMDSNVVGNGAVYQFDLGEEFTDQVGSYICELTVTCIVDGEEELVTCDPFNYTIKASSVTGLNDEIEKKPELPILEKLINDVNESTKGLPENMERLESSLTKVDEWDDYFEEASGKLEEKYTERLNQHDEQFNTKANQSDLEIEKNRLDNLIVNNNPTEGNAELIDIRVGADGTTYENAGKAIRTQFGNNSTRLTNAEEKNTTQDNRLDSVENKNKIQDIYLNGLFNENSDGRLTINGEGNELKLEGSKAGLVTVDSVVGNTFNNLIQKNSLAITGTLSSIQDNKIKLVQEDTLEEVSWRTSYNLKANSIYSLVYTVYESTIGTSKLVIKGGNTAFVSNDTVALNTTSGAYVTTFVGNPSSIGNSLRLGISSTEPNGNHIVLSDVMYLFEGDYTNKPIPTQAFEGLQSTFEDKKVTQEMVDSGTELAENLGKYKVSAKVVGKNLFDGELREGKYNTDTGVFEKIEKITSNSNFMQVKSNTTYSILRPTLENGVNTIVLYYDNEKKYISTYLCVNNGNFITPSNAKYINFHIATISFDSTLKIQIEEGAVATPYEPYFESTHNIYLNSPSSKGDTLECRSDGVYHVKNGESIVLDGNITPIPERTANTNIFRWVLLRDSTIKPNSNSANVIICDKYSTISPSDTWGKEDGTGYYNGICANSDDSTIYLYVDKYKTGTVEDRTALISELKSNPITVVYKLKQPWEEKISDNKFLCEIDNGSTLHLDSNVPCTNVRATYTSNIVSVVKLDKIQYEQDKVAVENAYKLSVLGIMTGVTI